MDKLVYHIFINQLVNHAKNNFIKYRKFILIFALLRTTILSTIFFHTTNFFSHYNSRLFSKMENRKTKAKNHYQANKEKLKERLQVYYRNLSEDKLKKRNYASIRNKNMSDGDREIKKECTRNYYYK